MRSELSAPLSLTGQGRGLQAFARRQIWRATGLALFGFVGFALAALGTWNVADPSFSHATANPVTNAMGYPGAVFSDIAMQFYGLSSVAGLVPAVIWGVFLVSARGVDRMPRRAAAGRTRRRPPFGAGTIARAPQVRRRSCGWTDCAG